MKKQLDMAKIAKGLDALRRGKVHANGGYAGALGLAADIGARFPVPEGEGRSTDPQWTERRLVAFAPRTLRRLSHLAERMRVRGGVRMAPMQLAALLLEKTTERLSEQDAEGLIRRRRTGQTAQAGARQARIRGAAIRKRRT